MNAAALLTAIQGSAPKMDAAIAGASGFGAALAVAMGAAVPTTSAPSADGGLAAEALLSGVVSDLAPGRAAGSAIIVEGLLAQVVQGSEALSALAPGVAPSSRPESTLLTQELPLEPVSSGRLEASALAAEVAPPPIPSAAPALDVEPAPTDGEAPPRGSATQTEGRGSWKPGTPASDTPDPTIRPVRAQAAPARQALLNASARAAFLRNDADVSPAAALDALRLTEAGSAAPSTTASTDAMAPGATPTPLNGTPSPSAPSPTAEALAASPKVDGLAASNDVSSGAGAAPAAPLVVAAAAPATREILPTSLPARSVPAPVDLRSTTATAQSTTVPSAPVPPVTAPSMTASPATVSPAAVSPATVSPATAPSATVSFDTAPSALAPPVQAPSVAATPTTTPSASPSSASTTREPQPSPSGLHADLSSPALVSLKGERGPEPAPQTTASAAPAAPIPAPAAAVAQITIAASPALAAAITPAAVPASGSRASNAAPSTASTPSNAAIPSDPNAPPVAVAGAKAFSGFDPGGTSDSKAGFAGAEAAVIEVVPEAAPDTDFAEALPLEPATASSSSAETRVGAAPVRGAPETVASLAAEIARKLDARNTRFEVALDPLGLGMVNVSIDIGADGKLSAQFAFERPEAAAEMRGRSQELQRALEQAGFDLSKNSLNFDGGQGRERGHAGGDQPRHQNARAQAFQQALLSAEAADTLPTQALRWSDRSRAGLDVRI